MQYVRHALPHYLAFLCILLLAACDLVEVPDPSAPTVEGAPTIVDFSASSLAGDGSAELSWRVSDETSLSIDQGVGDVTGQSSVTVTPEATTTYTLSATNGEGTSTASATVTVSGSGSDPGADPAAPDVTIESIGPLTLEDGQVTARLEATVEDDSPTEDLRYTWNVTGGEAENVSLATRNEEDTDVSFSAAGSYTLTLTVSDGDEEGKGGVTVVVKEDGEGGEEPGPQPEPETCTNPVEVPDQVLRAAIKEALGLAEDAEITCAGLADLVKLDSGLEIGNFEGLQYAVNLEYLDFRDGSVSDLSPLSNLTKLRQLFLFNNNISDISPLANLTNLEYLGLGSRPDGIFSDTSNNITDLTPLSNLSKLERLDIDRNGLSSFEGLQGLNLVQLAARENSVEDLGPLSELASLEELVLPKNSVGDLGPLSEVASLEELTLDDNNLSDLGPLADLSNIRVINVDGNQISDLSPLSNIESLLSVDLSRNLFSDIQPLVDNSSLNDIRLYGNPNLDTCPGSEAIADIITLLEREDMTLGFTPCGEDDSEPNPNGSLTVTSSSGAASLEDECTLRAAITAANTDTAVGGCPAGSGADTIVLADETYTLDEVDNETEGASGLPVITSEIIISGNGATVERAEDAPNFRLLYVGEEANLTLEDVTLQNGELSDGNGGGVFNNGTATITASSIRGNGTYDSFDRAFSVQKGGGIFNVGTLILEGSEVENNQAAEGGGIYNQGDAIITNMVASGNEAEPAFGSMVLNLGTLEMTGSTLQENGQEIESGTFQNRGTATLRDSLITKGAGFPAGVDNDNDGILTIENTRITDQNDEAYGMQNRGNLVMRGGELSRNSDSSCCSGFINYEGASATFEGTLITSNSGQGDVFINAGELTFTDVIYEFNLKGIRNSETATFTVRGSTISGNGEYGIENRGTLFLTNSTVSGNGDSFEDDSSGINNSGTAAIAYSTITQRSYDPNDFSSEDDAPHYALFNQEGGSLSVVNSIVTNRFGAACGGAITSQGYNLDSDGSCNLSQESDLSGIDPQLGELQDNGGPTLTHALNEGSPALDAVPTGACEVDADQRGVARPQGEACDIGAFELEQ